MGSLARQSVDIILEDFGTRTGSVAGFATGRPFRRNTRGTAGLHITEGINEAALWATINFREPFSFRLPSSKGSRANALRAGYIFSESRTRRDSFEVRGTSWAVIRRVRSRHSRFVQLPRRNDFPGRLHLRPPYSELPLRAPELP